MKTRDRILAGALALFNDEGAAMVSAVDIAAALGISPGHLYYHFKGKAEIIAVLFDGFEAELALVLEGALGDIARPDAGLDDLHTHVLIVLEEVHDVRFLFREAGTLAQAFPALAPRYRRVLAGLRGAMAALLEVLVQRGVIDAAEAGALARDMAAGIAFKLAQFDLEADPEPPRQRIARAVTEIMTPIRARAT
ncbi:MAG: TetR family transcriptional regulator [Hyphomonadaceae bacterium]|nr:TetR family transcriptional regulator [Hyphomonadaceae bacterium]